LRTEFFSDARLTGAYVVSTSTGYFLQQDNLALFASFWEKTEQYFREFFIDDPITLAIIRRLMTSACVTQE
jgi:hypothetical protein